MSQTESWTIGRLLTWTADYLKQHGSDSSRLDAEILLAEARGCQRIELYTSYDELPDEQTRTAFRELVRRRADGMPVGYLIGRRDFFSLTFHVSPDVLIPRPETEFVVITLLDLIKKCGVTPHKLAVADVGTGSGILAICAARHAPQCQITAIDISPEALAVAARNVSLHKVEQQVRLVQSDLFDGMDQSESFDFIVSNPPYITTAEMETLAPEVKDHEPHLALTAGALGLDVISRLLPQAADRLRDGGWLLIEISPMLERPVMDLVAQVPSLRAGPVVCDLAGHARVVQAEKISPSGSSDLT